jgi:hypothetical protein
MQLSPTVKVRFREVPTAKLSRAFLCQLKQAVPCPLRRWVDGCRARGSGSRALRPESAIRLRPLVFRQRVSVCGVHVRLHHDLCHCAPQGRTDCGAAIARRTCTPPAFDRCVTPMPACGASNKPRGRAYVCPHWPCSHWPSRWATEVVAEGIETEQQLSLLQAIGCSRGQGFSPGPT